MKKDIDNGSNLDNTLDLYDDAITINAVGRLLDKSNPTNNETAATDDLHENNENYVTGFDKESQEDPRNYLYSNNLDDKKNSRLNTQKREVKYPKGYEPPTRRGSTRQAQNMKSEDTVKNKNSHYSKGLTGTYAGEHMETEHESSISTLKVVTFATFIIILATLAFLVYRLNSVTTQLEHLQVSENTMENADINIGTLIERNEELLEQVIALETTVTDLQHQIEGNSIGQGTNQINTSSPDINQEVGNQQSANQSSGTSTSNNITHIVQSGQNLSTISEEFYGTSNEFQRIIDANNLQTDNLYVGQVLIIPQ